MKKNKFLFEGSDWTFDTIRRIADACHEINDKELKLDLYPNQFEIITSDQMLDAYASIGMPISYNHWSFGKLFLQEEQSYRSGRSGLAYEIVVNLNPAINYLMEENSATIQATVVAHAGFGHNFFFKNNYLFKEWTQADSMLDYLVFARNYVAECEERHGYKAVESILDSAHALRYQGVDRYKRPSKLNLAEEKKRQKEREEYVQKRVNVLWESIEYEKARNLEATEELGRFPESPEENILKFIEKNSIKLQPWQRELIRIVRKISHYFYPQRQTQVANEGFACWTHCYMMNRLYEKGLLSEGAMLEFLHVHSNVVYQPSFERGRFNPYALGLNMFKDIERICKNPTAEDKEWFPHMIGENYLDVIKDAVKNYRDESFIRQFLSPKLMRDMRMFQIGDDDDEYYLVKNIHNDAGYKEIRRKLADQYELSNIDPNIQIVNANLDSTRTLQLEHYMVNDQKLSEDDACACLEHIKNLWGYEAELISVNSDNEICEEYTTGL